MSKFVFRYDPVFPHEFIESIAVQESPFEPGQYLDDIPSTSKSSMLLPAVAGLARCFDPVTMSWEYRADVRGIWYMPDRTPVLINGLIDVVDQAWTREPLPLTWAERVALKLEELKDKCETAISVIKVGLPESEVSSWPKQEAEARAWLASNTAVTPLLDALSTSRNITKDVLVTRIIAKADAYAAFSGQLIGKRQKLEDQATALAANDDAGLAGIVW